MIDLITGGGGYLGSAVARALLDRGRTVRILDVHRTLSCPEEAEYRQADIRDRAAVRSALEGVERVIHIAFVQSLSRRPEHERHEINIGGMRDLLEESTAAGVKRFVFASTIEIYGTRPPFPCGEDAPTDRPVGWYGRHKLECERIMWAHAKRTGLHSVALRMPTICGPGFYNHRPLLELMERILCGRRVAVIGEGRTPGDFVLLEDVVQGFLLAAERPRAVGEAFNISGAGTSSHREILEAMIRAAGSSSKIIEISPLVARLGIGLARLLRLHDLPADQDDYLFHPNHYSSEKARAFLGYAPSATSAQAAAALIRGYRAHRDAVRARSVSY